MAVQTTVNPQITDAIATHLRRALTKLRLRSRSELIRSIQVGGLPALATPGGSVPGR